MENTRRSIIRVSLFCRRSCGPLVRVGIVSIEFRRLSAELLLRWHCGCKHEFGSMYKVQCTEPVQIDGPICILLTVWKTISHRTNVVDFLTVKVIMDLAVGSGWRRMLGTLLVRLDGECAFVLQIHARGLAF